MAMTRASLRVRLTLWYAGSLAVILLLFAAGVYSLLARTIRARLDGQLEEAVRFAAVTLRHEIEEHHGQGPGEESVRFLMRTTHQTSYPQIALAIFRGDTLVAAKNGREGQQQLKPANAGFLNATFDGVEYRVLAREIAAPRVAERYFVVANQSTAGIDAELHNLRNVLLLLIPATILLAGAGGLFLMKRSLDPVSSMAQTAGRITSANLSDERLRVDNPADELGRLGTAFNNLLDRLEQSFTQQKAFVADASHELRTPLYVALTAAQVALQQKDPGAADQREALQLVEEQLRRLKRVVEDLFMLAQADAGAYRLPDETFYLNEVADEALRGARVLAQARQIDLEGSGGGEDLTVRGDEGLIRQLLLILLDNAVKFTPPGGRVGLRVAHEAGKGYEVEVSDTGPGIPEADRARIFDRFYRGDKARSRSDRSSAGSGAGLGLAIARWIAELHGGSIALVESEAGSRFRVFLPEPGARLSSI